MMRQRIVVLRQTRGTEPFDGLRGALMQDLAPLQQDGMVGHFLREGVLERIFQLGEQPCLIEELRGLQMRQAPVHGRHGPSTSAWSSVAGTRCRGRRPPAGGFFLPGQPVDARCQHRLHRGRHLHGSAGLAPDDRPHARRPGPRSRPGRARSLPERRDCPPYAQSRAGEWGRLASSPSRACKNASALTGGRGSSRSCV